MTGFTPFSGTEHTGEAFKATGAGGSPSSFGTLTAAGTIFAITGAINSTIGAYYAAESAKYNAESLALTLGHEATISSINARAAENDASLIFQAGRHRRAVVTLQHGQAKAAQRVSIAARGIRQGVGSAGEVLASNEFAKDVDAFVIDRNTFMEVSAARRRAVNLRNQAGLGRVSAANAARSASSIRPGLIAATEALSGTSRITNQLLEAARFERLFAERSGAERGGI